MKIARFAQCLAAAASLAAFATAGSAKNEKIASAISPPTMAVVTMTVTDAKSRLAAKMQFTVAPNPEANSANWADIKDCTFDQRGRFFTGLNRLEAKVDAQIAQLTAKRATMNSTVNTKEWDFAMKEMVDARTNLKSTREELSKATADTWDQGKNKVGQAWVRTQTAFANVKSSTTS